MTRAAPDRNWTVLGPQLDRLLSLSEVDQAQWLAELAQRDAANASQLRSLLSARDAASRADFLADESAPEILPAQAQAGDRLGAWRLVSLLGEGGMGTVWLAERTDGRYDGQAAIKLLRTGLFDASSQARFRREGAILARLHHPGIAPLLDAGISERGQPYLVLEYVQGEQIDAFCAARRLGVKERVELFQQVLDAVTAAHAQMVIHRDLKPSNILVDDSGRVRLLDFGLARFQDDAAQDQLTRVGAWALTPEYAAPEQFEAGPLSMATDVYALGVVLYELLTGVRPNGLPAGATPLDCLRAAKLGNFRPASVAAPELQRALRGDLDNILARALRLEAHQRYVSVPAFADDLNRYLKSLPVLARPTSWAYRAQKFIHRHPAASAIAGAIVLALVGGAHAQLAVLLALSVGTAAALWQARAARREAASARTALQRAEQVKAFIASIFTEATPREGAGGVVTAAQLLAAACERVESELKAYPAVAAELGVLIAQSAAELSALDIADKAVAAALPRCLREFGRLHPLSLRARCLSAAAANYGARFEQAVSLALELVDDLRAALPAHAELMCKALCELSFGQAKFMRKQESFAALHEAVRVGEAHLGLLHADTLYALGLLSNTYTHYGEHAAALEVAALTVQRARQAYGAQRPHSQIINAERLYASALINQGQPATAEPLARQAVVDQTLLDGGLSARVLQAMNMHGLALAGMGRTQAGLAIARQVRDEHRRLLPADATNAAIFTGRVALMLAPVRCAAEIEEQLAQEELLWRRASHEPVVYRQRRTRLRGQLQAQAGKDDLLRACLQLLEQQEESAHNRLERVRLLRLLARALRWQGRTEAAVAVVNQALAAGQAPDIIDAESAAVHAESALVFLDLGDVPSATLQCAQAVILFERYQVEVCSLVRSDLLLAEGRLALLAGDSQAAAESFGRLEQAWAEQNPRSLWHAEAACWFGLAWRASGAPEAADSLLAWARPLLLAGALPALRQLAGRE
ncbi:serine/threonine-protein kinase [Roseateles sp.]|uniref:serine/threonine-protein kinase n=1 Tax=Roseateles sp. TaxID=1971397 RepID=UPI00286BA587|nr:serine/threonine-protein kinase [Roseateles sp.]